jgi:hypothetical protein
MITILQNMSLGIRKFTLPFTPSLSHVTIHWETTNLFIHPDIEFEILGFDFFTAYRTRFLVFQSLVETICTKFMMTWGLYTFLDVIKANWAYKVFGKLFDEQNLLDHIGKQHSRKLCIRLLIGRFCRRIYHWLSHDSRF